MNHNLKFQRGTPCAKQQSSGRQESTVGNRSTTATSSSGAPGPTAVDQDSYENDTNEPVE